MAKNKEEKTNVMRVLEQKKIAYTAHTYPHEEGMAVLSPCMNCLIKASLPSSFPTCRTRPGRW